MFHAQIWLEFSHGKTVVYSPYISSVIVLLDQYLDLPSLALHKKLTE